MNSIYTRWDYITLKYSSSGEWKWIRRYNDGNSEVNSITTDRFNNVFVTGKTDGNFLSYKYTTIKYSTEGNLLWTDVYNGITLYSNNWGVSIRTDSLGNAYVTGNSESTGSGIDIATIKYSAPTGINSVTNEIPVEFKLFQNYPNPFNPVTKIQYQIVNQGMVTLKVYDLLGREVKLLVNEIKSPGKYIVSFDASSLSSGVYFYKISAGEFSDVKRMVLVK